MFRFSMIVPQFETFPLTLSLDRRAERLMVLSKLATSALSN